MSLLSNADIMRQKQKKFEEKQNDHNEEKPEKKTEYQEDEDYSWPRLLILHPIIDQTTFEYFIKTYKKHNILTVCPLSKGPSDDCLEIDFKINPKTWGVVARTDRIPFALLPDHFVWSRMMLL